MKEHWQRLGFLLTALLVACGPDQAAKKPDPAGPIVAAAERADTTCPATGAWERCSVIKAIERAGLNAHADSAKPVTEEPLSITGFSLPISRGEVRVFVYADSGSRKRDEAKLDPKAFVLPAEVPGLRRERTLIRSANLLALMNVLNPTNRDRISNALMAGPPQPPSKKP